MTAHYYGSPVMVVAFYAHTALIKQDNGLERQVPLRALTDEHGRTYDHLTIPKPTPPDVLADRELSRAGKKELMADRRPRKKDTLCA